MTDETPSPAKALFLKIEDAKRAQGNVTLTVAEAEDLLDVILFEWDCNHAEHCGCDDLAVAGGDPLKCKWPYPGSERRNNDQ